MANVISRRAVSRFNVWANIALLSFASVSIFLSSNSLLASDAETIRQAIDELSSDSFSKRIRAEKQLLQIGSPAENALIAALDAIDPGGSAVLETNHLRIVLSTYR